MLFTELSAKNNKGETVDFSIYKGKIVLVVNVARLWDVSDVPGLISLREKYSSQGLEVLFFPCNQFCQEEPGSPAEIAKFYVEKHGLPASSLMERRDVNGENTQPVYKFLRSGEFSMPIEWNYTKFIVGRDGQVQERLPQSVSSKFIDKMISRWL